ncbi:dihydroorotate dehydrogenase [Bacillus shivajii]|uniref:dihydroorotate dehydrogenase n=1 Tax=Bacillus shivajii TaxID=1983719 RepID=UPI001CF9E187|nr:dihydroorotate dehydrogenase [Bacillus shivajii]UCZ53824.1 dihydroorotate dehydrogenase [Bacillus shivajii]
MPDWSYHLLFKPVLNHFSPERSRAFIHRAMNVIASTPGGRHVIHFLGREESSPLHKKHVEGIDLSNSIGLSGKLDPHQSGTKAFSHLGFGFIEIGPITKSPIDVKAPIVDRKNKVIDFPSAFASIGLKNTKEKLDHLSIKQPLFIRLSGKLEELLDMIDSLSNNASAFIIHIDDLLNVEHTLITSRTEKPIFISVNAQQLKDLPFNKVSDIERHYSGIALDEQRSIKDKTNLDMLINGVNYLRRNAFTKTIITTGGVLEPDDALQLFDAKADLIMLSGGYVFSGPGLPKRIKEAQLNDQHEPRPPKGWGWYFLFGFSMFIGGIIALILSMTTVILPYDEHFLGMTREEIIAYNERIFHFMAHDRMTLAGTMISGSIIYMSLAWFGIKNGLLWAKQATDTAAIIGFLGIFLFIGYGYFDWLHLIFWLILAPFFITGLIQTKHINGTPASSNRFNDRTWKLSIIGQLSFVILGFSFVLGGFIISYIGVTGVFVETDIHYLHMPPEMLHEFNERLVPVIAHDRAGFGSALLSVGLLVLMLALWGFHQGKQWIWWTFCLGGVPAFAAGIGVHFSIHYTDFIHLLPAYYALFLYMIGLITTFHFFHQTRG